MTAEEIQLSFMQGMFAQLPDDTKKAAQDARVELLAVVEKHGDAGLLGFGLLGAELSVKAEREKWCEDSDLIGRN